MPKKQNEDSTYGEKLIRTFAALLFTGQRKSMTDLARMLGCSKPTVRRIVNDISFAYSVQIMEETVGKQLVFWIDKPAKIPVLSLSIDELAVLEMCSAFTRHLLGKSQFEEAARGLQKSQGLLPPNTAGTSGKEFACFSPGSIDYTPHQEVLRNLIEAITKKKVCNITYQALGAEQSRAHHIMPLKIFSHKDTVYVHARRCAPAGEPFTDDDFYPLLAVHRFKKVTVLENNYEFPANYDFEGFFNRTFGVIKGESFRVKARFTGWAAKYISERIWSANQKITQEEEGSVILEFDATSESEVVGWVLSFGAEAVLLGPDSLKKIIKTEINNMVKYY